MQTPEFYPLIPDEAFLINPQNADIIRSKQRLIFEGTITYSNIQNEKLALFRSYLEKTKITLDPFWTSPARLRFLQSCEFNNERSLKQMNGYLDWVKKQHPLVLTAQIQMALKQGLIYFCGRDFKYRPIMVFDVRKTLDSELPTEVIIAIYTYYLDFVVKNLLVEGHVENWVLVVDLNESGVFSTIGMLQKVLAAMSNRFRCRMHSCHIVRCPGAFSFLWRLVKKFLDEVTIQKISFTSKSKPQNLFTRCNPSQLEKKFDGTTPTFVEYWPVSIKSRVYDISQPISLTTVETYKKMFKSEELINQKINKNFVQNIDKEMEIQKQNEKQREKDKEKEMEKQKQREKQKQTIKHFTTQVHYETRHLRQQSAYQKPRSTIYNLHPQLIQNESRTSITRIEARIETQATQNSQEFQIQDEGTANQIVHFVCSKKPVTFSFYAS